jgi:gamma-glutamylcyclotransferase (GGCT)/AIG2-like uncharacterized protein YtfP
VLLVELGMQSIQHNIFVYGSLKRGFINHSLLTGQRFVASCRTEPRYKLYDLGDFPGMIEATTGGRSIEGEIWSIDSECLAQLEILEDTAHGMYARVPILLLPPHDKLSVAGYLYQLEVTCRHDCGDVWTE